MTTSTARSTSARRSAPLKSGVRFAVASQVEALDRPARARCSARICSRAVRRAAARRSGGRTGPAASSASSTSQGAFVAASTRMPSLSAPIASSSCSTWSTSGRPALPACLRRAKPIASSSSRKSTHGANAAPARTRRGGCVREIPKNGSRISSIRTFENGSPHSPAVARASSVLPQPGSGQAGSDERVVRLVLVPAEPVDAVGVLLQLTRDEERGDSRDYEHDPSAGADVEKDRDDDDRDEASDADPADRRQPLPRQAKPLPVQDADRPGRKRAAEEGDVELRVEPPRPRAGRQLSPDALRQRRGEEIGVALG